jgi:hypothetical protein
METYTIHVRDLVPGDSIGVVEGGDTIAISFLILSIAPAGWDDWLELSVLSCTGGVCVPETIQVTHDEEFVPRGVLLARGPRPGST